MQIKRQLYLWSYLSSKYIRILWKQTPDVYWINLITGLQLNMNEAKRKREKLSRVEIINWINSTLKAGLTAIEELGSGAVFCKLLLKAHPKAIQQHCINYQATTTYEFTNNFRLLQNAFAELGIERPLDVEALARSQYKDNFELAVWFYWYIDGQQPQTDCTLSSQGQPLFDFSFARKKVTPKYFTPRRCREDGPCSCSTCQIRGEWRLRQRVRELQAKFQMMEQVLRSQQTPEDMCFLIQEIIDLSAI